ncbi:MAG TPA: biosynthetic peptidoglycan transglycosylase [Anaeromyxobacteraceae bacterium]|nr:biosynthetic peptidoglycan transglycosylase [Anaeromyxobacteraceae bacterium]
MDFAALEAPSGRQFRSRRLRAVRFAIAGLAALAVLWGSAIGWANLPAVRGRLRAEAERALRQRLVAATLGDQVAVDFLGRLRLGPLAVPPSRPGLPPVLRVEQVRVQPRWPALLAGRFEPAVVSLSAVRVEAGAGGEELLALAHRLPSGSRRASRPAAGAAVAPPEIRFRDLVVAATASGERVEVGPLDGEVVTRAEGARARLRLPSGGSASLLLAPRGERTAARLAVEDAALADLPEALRRRLPFPASRGALSATLESQDLDRGGAVALRARDLELGPDREPLGSLDVAFRGEARWGAAAHTVEVEQGVLSLGPDGEVPVALSAALTLGGDPAFSLELRAADASWASLCAALPPALVPEEVRRLSGPLGARLSLSGPTARPAEWRVEAELDLKALRRALHGQDRLGLGGEFTWRPPGAAGPVRPVRVGPGNPDFVPLADLPHHVVRAVTTSEDGGFFAHSGFDFEEIRNALAERAESGRVRGASTITQQLAKNLFLDGERTLARKVREALLTVALEASLPKSRLLEIYLNIVEWGPGLHGIGPAARHYFAKDARQLTPREAAFLASVIPSPARFHALFERGEMTEGWLERIDAILLHMAAFGQLGEDQLMEALRQPLVFARG